MKSHGDTTRWDHVTITGHRRLNLSSVWFVRCSYLKKDEITATFLRANMPSFSKHGYLHIRYRFQAYEIIFRLNFTSK